MILMGKPPCWMSKREEAHIAVTNHGYLFQLAALFNNSLIRLDRPESTTPKKTAIMKTATKTTAVPERVSFREGHVTFFNSVLTSLKNCLAPSNFDRIENSIAPPFGITAMNCVGFMASRIRYMVYGRPSTILGTWQARRDSNPHHPDLESGALSVRATGLSLLYPYPPTPAIISSPYEQYACGRSGNIFLTPVYPEWFAYSL